MLHATWTVYCTNESMLQGPHIVTRIIITININMYTRLFFDTQHMKRLAMQYNAKGTRGQSPMCWTNQERVNTRYMCLVHLAKIEKYGPN